MSIITHLILVVSPYSTDDVDVEAVKQVAVRSAEYSRSMHDDFVSARALGGDNSLIPRNVFHGTAVNFEPEKFIEVIKTTNFQYPESIHVFTMDDNAKQFTELQSLWCEWQGALMHYNPATGEKYVVDEEGAPENMSDGKFYTNDAAMFRENYQNLAWLYDPWTGLPRDAKDVGEDLLGRNIMPSPVEEMNIPSVQLHTGHILTPSVIPTEGGSAILIKPSFVHITDLPAGTPEEQIAYMADYPNPENLPIKVWPEPEWLTHLLNEASD